MNSWYGDNEDAGFVEAEGASETRRFVISCDCGPAAEEETAEDSEVEFIVAESKSVGSVRLFPLDIRAEIKDALGTSLR